MCLNMGYKDACEAMEYLLYVSLLMCVYKISNVISNVGLWSNEL